MERKNQFVGTPEGEDMKVVDFISLSGCKCTYHHDGIKNLGFQFRGVSEGLQSIECIQCVQMCMSVQCPIFFRETFDADDDVLV